jgi:hypothetical protein
MKPNHLYMCVLFFLIFWKCTARRVGQAKGWTRAPLPPEKKKGKKDLK